MAEETSIKFITLPNNPETGLLDYSWLGSLNENELDSISAFVFPQVNNLGLLEDVDLLTNFHHQIKLDL